MLPENEWERDYEKCKKYFEIYQILQDVPQLIEEEISELENKPNIFWQDLRYRLALRKH